MTKLKKSIAACVGSAIIFMGAVVGTLPAQYTVYAEGEGTNSWIAYPRITGWEYGSFSLEENMLVALPQYGANVVDYMKYSFKDGNGKPVCDDVYVAVDRSDNSLSYYYPNSQKYRNEDLVLLFNGWTPGNYTVNVTVTENMPQWSGLEAQVPFTVSKAKNYWTVAPGILSWYEDEAGANPAPYGTSAYGTVFFTVYGLKLRLNGEYETDGSGNYVVDYNSVYPINNLAGIKEGIYALVAEAKGTENYEGITATTYFRVFGSEASLTELKKEKESALDELDKFAKEYGVKLSDLDSAVTNGIPIADTVKGVKNALEGAKVAVYKKYALDSIAKYESTVSEEKYTIEQAGDMDSIKTALASAQEKINGLLVQRKKLDAQGQAQQFATQYDVAYNSNMQGIINSAQTLGEVDEALGEVRKDIIEAAFEKATDLETYKERVKQAIVLYAVYLGVDQTEMGTDIITRFQAYVEISESRDAVTARYEGKGSAKAALDGIRSNEQAQFMRDLTEAVDNYKGRYPAAADKLDEIIARVREGINSQLTVPKSRREYEKALAEIKESVLEPAKEATIEQLKAIVAEAGMTGSYNTDSVVEAINGAESIEEVEAIFNAARHEIGSALYESRAEKVAELDAYAEAQKYYTDYNWNAIKNAVADGKKGINAAQTYTEINAAFEKAKLGIVYAWTVAELDRYASVYKDYNVASAVEMGKNRLQTVHTEEEYSLVLEEAKAGMCAAAKEKAIADLTAHNDYYPDWDKTDAVRKIGLAETVEEVAELYSQADKDLTNLVNQRNAAIDSAREMLTIYAQNLGVEDLKAVKDAILGILAAQTSEDVPALFDTAKAEIDRAADAEQKRIASSNRAAVAFACIFAVAVVGLGTALWLVLRRNSAKKKKNDTQPPRPRGPVTPPPSQGSVNYPVRLSTPSNPEGSINYPPRQQVQPTAPQPAEPPRQQAQPTAYPYWYETPSLLHEEPETPQPAEPTVDASQPEEPPLEQAQLSFYLPPNEESSIQQEEPTDGSQQAPPDEQEPHSPSED